jgi:glycosyltransferase involved in cell wall biosynthesis
MISIVIPAFKSKYLKEAIKSVLDQTYDNFELIIVNDKSPDDIRSIVDSFNDSRIRYYENDYNIGKESVVKNWNKCLSYSKGELFLMFSDDDLLETEFLQEMVLLANKYPDVDIFHSRVRQIDGEGQTITYSSSCPEWESCIDFIWHRLKDFRLQYVTEFVSRTGKLKKIGGFVDLPLAWGSDDITWFSMSKEKGIVCSSKVLSNFRYSSINISRIGNLEKRLEGLNLYYVELVKLLDRMQLLNSIEKDLYNEIIRIKNKTLSNQKAYILALVSNNNLLTILANYIKVKKRYKLDFRVFIKALYFLFQSIFTK